MKSLRMKGAFELSDDNNTVVYRTPEEAEQQLEDEQRAQYEEFQEWQKEKMRKV
jgi:hypothetical protein